MTTFSYRIPAIFSHITARPRGHLLINGVLVVLLAISSVLLGARPAFAAGTIAVNTTTDEFGAGAGCSLREAVQSANTNADFGGCVRSGTAPYTINLGAGTFALTITGANNDTNTTGDLDFLVSGISVSGAGAANTTIQQTTADRVLDFNPLIGANFSASLADLTVTGGNTNNTFGGGGIIYGDSNGGGTLTLNGVTVHGNTASNGPGGGIETSIRGNLVINNSTISNNVASKQGGGMDFFVSSPDQLMITSSTITNNRSNYATGSLDAGGGLHTHGGTVTIVRSHFVNNQASNNPLAPDSVAALTGSGGAIANSTSALTVSFSRFVGNTAIDGTAIFQIAGGSATANDNWWGVNSGPASGVLAGAVAPTATRWLQLRHAASPASIPVNSSTTLTADILGLNTGGTTAAANLTGLPPFPQPAGTIFSAPTLGTLSGEATQFVNGEASATYNAGATSGTGTALATADSQSEMASITLSPLAVMLETFSAEAQADQVLLSWVTATELNNRGFNIWRGLTPDAPDRQLNSTLIPSQAAGTMQGFSYTWPDQADLVPGTAYFYWLDAVDTANQIERYGPVSAVFGQPTAVTLQQLSAASRAAAPPLSWQWAATLVALAGALWVRRQLR
ncbi:MAG: CSLREA domain-containing protein [Caldilineales bacterium]